MPELPEVQTVAAQLSAGIVDRTIRAVYVRRADYVRRGGEGIHAAMPGRRVESIRRHGKWISLVLAPQGELVIHLGMSGRVTLDPPQRALLPHTHLVIRFHRMTDELRIRDPRRFGGVWFYDGSQGDETFAQTRRLGPDALGLALPELRRLLTRRRQIKALLLDQTAVSGLGNIYCDEALHRAGVHPNARASDLSDAHVRRLADGIRRTLRSAIRAGGSTLRDYRNADGEPGWFQVRHRVYGRQGQPCRRCGTTIVRTQAAGRSTHWCPTCQPELKTH